MKPYIASRLKQNIAAFLIFNLMIIAFGTPKVAFAVPPAETINCGTNGSRTIAVGTYTDGDGSAFSSGADLTLSQGAGSACTFIISQDQAASAIALNSLTINDGVTLSQEPTGTTVDTYNQLKFNITEALTVNTGGAIDVTGDGYLGGTTTGNPSMTAYGNGNTTSTGSGYVSGGSHGGRGGLNYSGSVAATYDSTSNPVLPGGGAGGNGFSAGGNGGGVIVVTAGSLAVDGNILAEGESTIATFAGGAGGSINLTVSGAITGSGTISAMAKDSTYGDAVGGGGRIAIKNYTSLAGTVTLKVNGGNTSTSGRDGSSGTLFLKPSGQTYGDLYLDNASSSSPYYNTELPTTVPASDLYTQYGSGYVFNSVNVANYGILSVPSTLDDIATGGANLDRKFYVTTCEAADDDVSNGEIIYSAEFYVSDVTSAVYDYVCAAPEFYIGLSSSSGSASESTTSGSFTIGASGLAAGDTTVDYAVNLSSTATGGGTDYTLANGTATILSGTSSIEVPFTIINDTDRESSETIVVIISNPSTGTLTSENTFIYTITDNDTPVVTLAESDGSTTAGEGGSGDTYTLVLGTQPTADVTITVAGDADVGVDDTSLTFTSANWSTPQTITATAVDDGFAESSHTGTITHTASSSDVDYNGISISNVSVSISDNDIAGVTVSETSYSTSVNEQGPTTDTYTLVLNTEPTANVVIDPTTDADCTATPDTATFTTSNWSTPQTITVTAVNDTDQEGSHSCTLTHSITTDDTAYSSAYAMGIFVSVTDNDTPGITLNTVTSAAEEGGDAATYTFVLTSVPTDDVVITPNAGTGISDMTISPTTITFTSANWYTPQTVTATAVNDTSNEGYENITVDHTTASNDSSYNLFTTSSAYLAVKDNDQIQVTPTSSSNDVVEGGATDTYDVVLLSDPGSDYVTITITPDADTQTTPTELTFTSSDWSTPQTVTVTAVDDTDVEGSHTSTITYSVNMSYGTYYNAFVSDTTVNVTDNDGPSAGVTITESTSTAVTEGSTTDTYTVVLDTQPASDVTVNLSGTSDLSLSASALTFTSVNWETPQTITVTAVDDDIDEDSETPSITHTSSSSDSNYNGLTISSVTVTVTDNDTAGFTVGSISGNTTEAGGTSTFTVSLVTEPTADVTIPVSSSDTGEGTVSASSLTFTSGNWDTPQTITVTGVDDSLDDGNISYSIALGAVTSSDTKYDTLNPSDVSVTNMDNDAPGVTVSAISGNTTEAGGTATFTVVLDTEPTASVSIGVSSSDTGEGTVSASSLTFTTGNWNTPQTITVTGVDDDLDDGDVAYSVVLAAASSSDGSYDTLNPGDVSVTNTDGDTAGVTAGTISGNTTEAGGTATFTVVLDTEPTAAVNIGVSSSDTSEVTITSATPLTFTSVNWDTPQTVTVTGVDDDIDDGDVSYSLLLAAATSDDTSYNNLNPSDVSGANTDNDTAGVTVGSISGNTTESGGTSTFTVVLDTQPTANVSIGVSSSDTGEGTVSASTLTFTTSNWSTPQTVTVTGADDSLDDGDVSYSLVLAAASSSDSAYNTLNPSDVSATNTDNDSSGFSVGAISGNTTEAGATSTFTVKLTAQPTANVVIAVSSSDTTEGTVSASSLTFTSSNWDQNQTVTVTGVNDDADDGNVAYSIVLGAATSDDSNYNAVNPSDVSATNVDNDSSTFTIGAVSGSTTEAGGTATFTVVLNAQPTADVVIEVTSSDSTEGTVLPSSLTFTSSNWSTPQTVTATGVDDSLDDGDVEYSIVLGAATSDDSNYSTVNPTDASVTNTDGDTAGITVGTVSGNTEESGSTSTFTVVLDTEPTQDVTISVESSDTTEGTVSAGSLTFTSADWNTPQTVTITGVDDTADDGDVTYTIDMDTITSDDANYSALTVDAVSLSNTDDDATPTVTTSAQGSFFFTLVNSIRNSSSGSDDSAASTTSTSTSELAAELGVDKVVSEPLEIDGTVEKVVAIINEEEKTQVVIEDETEITDENGEPYEGTIEVPVLVAEKQVVESTGTFNESYDFVNALYVDTGSDEHIYFSRPVVVTLPLSDNSLSSKRLEVWTYNEKFNDWQKLDTEIVIDYKNRTVSFQVNRFSYVALLENQVFEDTAQHWASHYILELTKEGVVKGMSNYNFEPDRSITRAEMVKMVLLAFKYDVKIDLNSEFTDVPRFHWSYDYVNTAAEKGFVKGYNDNTFRPDEPVSRVEALKMIIKAARKDTSEVGALFKLLYPDVDAKAWYVQYLKFAAYREVVEHLDGKNFMPDTPITRAEAAKIIIRTRDLE